jgi:hypothetical protein
MQFIRSALITCLALASLTATAEVRVQGPVEFGIFKSEYKEFQPGERLLTQNNQTIERTTNIPAKLGTRFGIRYELSGKAATESPLTLLYLTPGLISPEGVRHDKLVVTQPLAVNAVQDVMAFEFTENYEIVPGDWVFMVFQDDRLLAKQLFVVE